jgi:hypothetical protein
MKSAKGSDVKSALPLMEILVDLRLIVDLGLVVVHLGPLLHLGFVVDPALGKVVEHSEILGGQDGLSLGKRDVIGFLAHLLEGRASEPDIVESVVDGDDGSVRLGRTDNDVRVLDGVEEDKPEQVLRNVVSVSFRSGSMRPSGN